MAGRVTLTFRQHVDSRKTCFPMRMIGGGLSTNGVVHVAHYQIDKARFNYNGHELNNTEKSGTFGPTIV